VARTAAAGAKSPTRPAAGPRRHVAASVAEKLWQESGLTLILVGHESSIARRAQRLGTMKNGKLTVKQAVQRSRQPGQPGDRVRCAASGLPA